MQVDRYHISKTRDRLLSGMNDSCAADAFVRLFGNFRGAGERLVMVQPGSVLRIRLLAPPSTSRPEPEQI